MICKIPITDLMVGMHVVDTGLSWLEHPYLYGHEGNITSSEGLHAVQEAGYLETFVDTERGQVVPLDTGPPSSAEPDDLPLVPRARLPLERELPGATMVHHDCLLIARDMLRTIQSGGELDVTACTDMVGAVVDSVTRNPDALLTLCKLRRHDAYTFTHGVNVSVLAAAFGSSLGRNAAELQELGLAGLFHDVGKTTVPDAILNKPGALSPQEFNRIRRHPSDGRRLLEGLGLPESILRGVAEHHERFDGSGYPNGLAGAAIHAWGRILAVVDVYDALTSRRCYKAPQLPTRALAVIHGMRGRDFPSRLAERFIKFLGPFPVGSCVRLTTGAIGFVRSSNPVRPLFPEVLLVLDAHGEPLRPPQRLDLAGPNAAGARLTDALNPAAHGLDPVHYLLENAS